MGRVLGLGALSAISSFTELKRQGIPDEMKNGVYGRIQSALEQINGCSDMDLQEVM